MNTYKIYKWTNLITGKGYVGQTCLPLHIRAGGRNMTGYRGCSEFWKAIQEYGTDCWQVEILREGLTAEEANAYEDVEIKNHGTLTPNGYNLKDRENRNRSQKSIDLQEKARFICESYREGMPTKEIANQLGCTSGTILTILHENNVQIHRNRSKERNQVNIDERAEYVCKTYREGMPVKEIANQLGCSTTLIYRILSEHNVQVPSRDAASQGGKDAKKNSSVWEKASFICKSYLAGSSAKDISDRLGCSESLIYNVLRQNSVQIRPRGKGNKGKRHAAAWKKASFICDSYRKGLSAKEIANQLDCNYITINKVLRQNGVQIRSGKRGVGTGLREKAEYICKSYREGVPVKEIANQLACSMASIYRILHENNVQVQTNNRKPSAEHRKKNNEAQLGMSQEQLIFLIQWYSGWGWSQRRIARELRKGQRTIAKYAKLAK